MKNFKQILFIAAVIVAAVSCVKETPEITVQSVTLNQTAVSINAGDTLRLVATVLPENAVNQTLAWMSANETVATVSESGLITGIKEGETVITAKAGEQTATCTVTVLKGAGNLRWSFDSEDRPVGAACYKFLQYNEGDVYEIFLYTGGNVIPIDTEWKEDLKDYPSILGSIHNIYNPKGVILFLPASFVETGKTVDLSVNKSFADFTEHRLPWAVFGMFGNKDDMTDKPGYPYFQMMFYGFEDKVKLGAAGINYGLTGTVTVKKTGEIWDITLENITRNTAEGSGRIFSGEYRGTIENWTRYGFGAPRIWLDEWLLFGANAL